MKLVNTLPLASTNTLDEYPYPRPKGIPDNWVNVLAKKELLEFHSQELHELAAPFAY